MVGAYGGRHPFGAMYGGRGNIGTKTGVCMLRDDLP